MKKRVILAALCGAALAADAQVRRSSRNVQPLTRRPDTAASGVQSGNTGLGVAVPKKEPAAETVPRVAYLGPRTGWGLVKSASPYYAPDGKRLGTLAGGTLFTYNGVKPSSRNDVLVCMLRRGAKPEGPFLLDCTDIAGYEGDPATVDAELVAQLQRYFTLNGRLAERRAALEEAAYAKNPHFETARDAQQAYQASIEKAAAMEREMNGLSGARKSKALDALRALKYEQAALKTRADRAAAAYKAWKDAHPLDPAALAADPRLQALRAEREQARKPVAHLIPDEP